MDWLTNAIKNLTNVWDNTTVAMINKAEELWNTLEETLKCFEIEPTIQFVYEYAHGLPGTLFRVSWKKQIWQFPNPDFEVLEISQGLNIKLHTVCGSTDTT